MRLPRTVGVLVVFRGPAQPSNAFLLSAARRGIFKSGRRNTVVLAKNRISTVVSSDADTRVGNTKKKGEQPPQQQRLFTEELNVIYDSKCNVCKLEIDFLRQRDIRLNAKQQQQPTTTDAAGPSSPVGCKLRFTDLESGHYDESDPANGGITYAVGMSSMHAVTCSGQILKGIPVFEKAYQQVQLGWLFRITHWPVLQQLANIFYDIFAKYRTLLTRGSTVHALVQAYGEKRQLEINQKAASTDCISDRCSTTTTTRTPPTATAAQHP